MKAELRKVHKAIADHLPEHGSIIEDPGQLFLADHGGKGLEDDASELGHELMGKGRRFIQSERRKLG